MSNSTVVNYSDTTPAAVGSNTNCKWQTDGNGNVSTYLPAATSTVAGAVPTPPNNTTTFLRGDATFAQVTEAGLLLADNTTDNVSTTHHGFAPKAPNDATKYLDGTGAYSVPSGGTGTVTHTAGNLTAHAVVVGNGSADEKVLSSLGTSTTVLHGNSSGDPAFSSVVEADLGLTDLTTANVSSSAHGFAPKNNGNATTFLDGTGAYSTPGAGTGGGFFSLAGYRRTGFVTASGPSSNPSGYGETVGANGNTTSFLIASPANSQASCSQCTSTTTSAFAGWTGGAQWVTGGTAHSNLNHAARVFISQITNCRMWIGLFNSSITNTTVMAHDSYQTDSVANSDCAAFRFSTVASDTNYQCVTCDGTNQTTTDSGVAADTKSHTFLIIFNDSVPNVSFYIDGNLVAVNTSHLPRGSKTMTSQVGIGKEGASALIGMTFILIQSDL